MKKKLPIILTIALLFSALPYNLVFASTTEVYNLTNNKKLDGKLLLDVKNVTLADLKKVKSPEIIWVQDDILDQTGTKELLQEDFKNGSEIYFAKKGITLSEVAGDLGIDQKFKFDLPSPKMDLSQAPQLLQNQIKEGKNVIIKNLRTENTTMIIGIKKVGDSYSSSEIRFDSPTNENIKKGLFEKTQARELNTSLLRGETAKHDSSLISVKPKIASADTSGWPVAWTNSTTDYTAGVDTSWNVTLYRHPSNSTNTPKVYAETLFLDSTCLTDPNTNLPNLLYSAWPRIDAGYDFGGGNLFPGTVMEYTPTNADYSNNTTYTMSLTPSGVAISWPFTLNNMGPGLHLHTYIFDKAYGTNTDYVWWGGLSENMFGSNSPTPNGLNMKPGLSFYVNNSNTWVLAQGQIWTYHSNNDGESSMQNNGHFKITGNNKALWEQDLSIPNTPITVNLDLIGVQKLELSGCYFIIVDPIIFPQV